MTCIKSNTSIYYVKPVVDSNLDWRFEFPRWDTNTCSQCDICYLSCPDSAIFQTSDGFYQADGALCKGCGVCAEQCPTDSISLETVGTRPPWLAKIP